MKNFCVGWYLIYTKPRHEKKVNARLNELKISTFLPTKKTLRTWHDRRKYVEEPLFPSYIFIYLNDIRDYYEGIDVEGSLYYVRTGKQIARVSDTEINNIRLVTEEGKDIEVSDQYFQPGSKLVINEGALTGLSCEVVQHNCRKQLLVRVELLQRSILLRLPAEHLMAI